MMVAIIPVHRLALSTLTFPVATPVVAMITRPLIAMLAPLSLHAPMLLMALLEATMVIAIMVVILRHRRARCKANCQG